METDDEDPFALDEEENVAIEEPKAHNPIEENLIQHLNEINEQIERAEKERDNIQNVTKKILDNLAKKAYFFDEDDSSESETERYDESCGPSQKRLKKKGPGMPPLIVNGSWQRIVDDKWVIGMDLQNTSTRTLEDPMMYVKLKDQDELHGMTCFWEMSEASLWNSIDTLRPDVGSRLVATIILDMPSFDGTDIVQGYGIISYRIEDRHLQVPIKSFQLTAAEAIDKSMTPRHSSNHENSILAIKAASVESIVGIPLGDELAPKLMDFLEVNGFNEVFPDVHVSTNTETLRYCIIEVMLEEDKVQLKIYARSMSQLNIVMHMLREEIPEAAEADKEDRLLEAARALEREIVLRMEGEDQHEIINASILTDLHISD